MEVALITNSKKYCQNPSSPNASSLTKSSKLCNNLAFMLTPAPLASISSQTENIKTSTIPTPHTSMATRPAFNFLEEPGLLLILNDFPQTWDDFLLFEITQPKAFLNSLTDPNSNQCPISNYLHAFFSTDQLNKHCLQELGPSNVEWSTSRNITPHEATFGLYSIQLNISLLLYSSSSFPVTSHGFIFQVLCTAHTRATSSLALYNEHETLKTLYKKIVDRVSLFSTKLAHCQISHEWVETSSAVALSCGEILKATTKLPSGPGRLPKWLKLMRLESLMNFCFWMVLYTLALHI